MTNTRAPKLSVTDDYYSNPLRQAGVLQRVLDYVGPGHWLFVSAVSKLWKDLYERVESRRMEKDRRMNKDPFTCVPR
jgi:hypothetical protein